VSRATRFRVLTGVGLALGVVTALAGPASAHVTLHSYEAAQGGSDAIIQIRVPNEEDNATTTQIEVDFPADTPLIGIYAEPAPGWQFQITNSDLPKPVTNGDGTFTQYVSKVVWSGGNIPVNGFMDFNVDVQDLPTVPTITVKALQTYSNGDIVRWIDPPAASGQPDPAHPAPTLDLAAPPAASGTPTTVSGGTPGGPATTVASGSSSSPPSTLGGTTAVSLSGYARTSDVNGTKTLSIIALVVGIVGVLAAGVALLSRRRTTGS